MKKEDDRETRIGDYRPRARGEAKGIRRMLPPPKKAFVMVLMAGLLSLLLSSFLEVPNQGSIENPSYNEVTAHYLSKAETETGAPNIVTGIIIDYRAFDTLGEATVLFTAIAAVLTVLKTHANSK